jgi:uncharacterized Zn finger protein
MKCKKCGYKMSKLYRLINHKPYKIPVVWYCKDCDVFGDKIKQEIKSTQIIIDSLGGYKIIKK